MTNPYKATPYNTFSGMFLMFFNVYLQMNGDGTWLCKLQINAHAVPTIRLGYALYSSVVWGREPSKNVRK